MQAKLSNRNRVLSWLLVALAFGLLLSLQLNSSPISPATTSPAGHSRAEEAIRRLEDEQMALKERIGQLRQALADYQQRTASTTELLEEIDTQLNYHRAIAGLVAAQGPGLEITLDDSRQQKIPAGDDPSDYIVHEYDLRDVINLLWLAGAEGIAINEERVVGATSIYCVGSTVMVNDTRLSPPYIVRGIGNPDTLESFVRNPSYLIEVKEKVQHKGLIFQFHRSPSVELPAYQGSFALKYARPGQ